MVGGFSIIYWNLGILLGMCTHGAVSIALLLFTYLLGGYSLHVNELGNGIGQVTLLVCGVGSWPLLGGLAGFIRDSFDDATRQI